MEAEIIKRSESGDQSPALGAGRGMGALGAKPVSPLEAIPAKNDNN